MLEAMGKLKDLWIECGGSDRDPKEYLWLGEVFERSCADLGPRVEGLRKSGIRV
jgi:hypothetical protein